MKSWVKVLIVSFLIVGFALGIGTNALAEEKTYKVIVVVHGGITHPFWKVEEKTALEAGDLYPDLEVSYLGPSVYNFTEFMSYIDSAIASKPDALVVTLTNPEAMDEPLRAAMAEGLPILAINAPDLREPEDVRIPTLTYIGEHSYTIGVTAAQETLKRFTPKRAVFPNHHPGAAHIEARGQGWIDVMTEKGVPVEQIDVTQDGVKGAEILAAYLKRHPDTDAIFLNSPHMPSPFISRLEDDGIKVGVDVKIAQMDLGEDIFEFIKQDKIMFAMDQQPYLQGFLGVQFAYWHAKYGLFPPALIPTGPAVISKENLAQAEEGIKAGYR